MADPRLIDYVRRNIQLGYTEEQLRKVLVSAGYNMRDIEDALDAVLRPQELTPQAPPEQTEEEKGFFATLPLWMILSGAAGIVLLVVIIILLIPSNGTADPGLLSGQGIKITTYTFECAGPASRFSMKITNEGAYDLSDVKLFIDDALQQEQIIPVFETGVTATYTFPAVNCLEWLGEKNIRIVSDKASAEGVIKFTCSTGVCT